MKPEFPRPDDGRDAEDELRRAFEQWSEVGPSEAADASVEDLADRYLEGVLDGAVPRQYRDPLAEATALRRLPIAALWLFALAGVAMMISRHNTHSQDLPRAESRAHAAAPEPSALVPPAMFRGDAANTGMTPGALGAAAEGRSLLLIGSNADALYAFNAADGALLWTLETGGNVTSTPAVDDGLVFIACEDGLMYAVDAATGEAIWTNDINLRKGIKGSLPMSSPVVSQGVVYVGSWDTCLYALDAETGEMLWDFETEGAIYSTPAVVGGKVIFGSRDRRLYCLSARDGSKLWSFNATQCIVSSPAVAGGLVYFGSDDGHVYALQLNTGSPVWHLMTGDAVTGKFAVGLGMAFVGSDDGRLYAFDAASGEFKWMFDNEYEVRGAPLLENGKVYLCAGDNPMIALDAFTGQLRWRALQRADRFEVNCSPAAGNGALYTAGPDGLYSLDAATGELKWETEVPGPFFSSPTLAD